MPSDLAAYSYLQENSDLYENVPVKTIREVVRKNLKMAFKMAMMEYHARKLAAFKAQRECFKRLMKMHTTMMCAAMDANPSQFIGLVNGKSVMKVKRSSMDNFRGVCFKSVEAMIKLGETYSEAEAQMYAVMRYTGLKKEWVKWKRMVAKVAVSDMKIETLLKLTVY